MAETKIAKLGTGSSRYLAHQLILGQRSKGKVTETQSAETYCD